MKTKREVLGQKLNLDCFFISWEMVPNKSNWRQRRINCENSSVPLCRGPFLIRDSFIYFSCCRRWAICKLLSDCLHVVCLCLNDRGYPSLLKILKIKFKGGDEAGLKSLYVCFAWVGKEGVGSTVGAFAWSISCLAPLKRSVLRTVHAIVRCGVPENVTF